MRSIDTKLTVIAFLLDSLLASDAFAQDAKETVPYRDINASGRWGVAAVPTYQMPDYLSVSNGIEVLKSNRDILFLSLGIYRPHVPWGVPQEYFDRHPLESLVMPERRANDLDDLPERLKLMAHNEGKFGPDYHHNAVAAGPTRACFKLISLA